MGTLLFAVGLTFVIGPFGPIVCLVFWITWWKVRTRQDTNLSQTNKQLKILLQEWYEAPEPGEIPPDLQEAYDRLDGLYSEALEKRDADPSVRARIQDAHQTLRSLQSREAHRIRRILDDSLSMPIGRGSELRDQTQILRRQYGDPPATDSTA